LGYTLQQDWLFHQARVSPGKPALVFEDRRWTYAELDTVVERLCARLVTAGVKRGQHVAVLMPNRPEFVAAIHALARLGAILVPLNTRLTPAELRWQIEQSDSRHLLCTDETAPLAAELAAPVVNISGIETAIDEHIKVLKSKNRLSLQLADTQGIIFTSGTTGHPKGAMLTFGNHFYSATASAYRLGILPGDRWMLAMPLYHVGGLAIVLRCCLYGTAVVLHPKFEPAAIAHTLRTQAISLISVVPTMLHRLLEYHADSLASPHLRCILVGGAALSPQLAELSAAYQLPVIATYGLTEAASQVATATLDEVARKPGSVGKPLLFTTVRIADPDGQSLPAGNIGEVVVSGPTVMAGYYRQPEATKQALRDGELFTGDLGYLDAEGDLWPVQRRADLIISGGENIYPAEVEAVLRQHPAVAEVCVIGLPDGEWGQRVAAAVVLKPQANASAEDLLALARRQLAGYKQPRRIRFVETLPLTASGKIRREAVRALFE
jgi:O-succinylbenzoic acid--CoA ligase